MAIRIVREKNDPTLRQQAVVVKRFDESLVRLVDDMFETLYHYNGVGLAAPQIGIAKRIVVIDANDGERRVLINPEIVCAEGSEVDIEGCLSVPGVYGEVERRLRVKVKAQDITGAEFVVDGEELLGRALQHEIDHLNGILFLDKVIRLVPQEEMADE